MTSLIEQSNQQSDQQQSDARAMYRELCQRADEPRPGDATKLRDVLNVLGMTTTAAESDIAAIDRVRELEAAEITPEQLRAASDAVEEATATARAEFYARAQRLLRDQRTLYEVERIYGEMLSAASTNDPTRGEIASPAVRATAIQRELRARESARRTEIASLHRDHPLMFSIASNGRSPE